MPIRPSQCRTSFIILLIGTVFLLFSWNPSRVPLIHRIVSHENRSINGTKISSRNATTTSNWITNISVAKPTHTKPTRSPREIMEDRFFTEVTHVNSECHNMTRVGRQGDGGWDICLDNGFYPHAPCLVYSFGVGGIWEFDEQMASKYNCTVRAFDPTMELPEHVHWPGPVNFYPVGIAGRTDKDALPFPVMTLLSFLKRFNETKKRIDVLKIDVEYWEWESLKTMMNDNLLGQVKLLVMEVHTKEVTKTRSKERDFHRYLNVFERLKKLSLVKYRATRNGNGVGSYRSFLSASQRRKSKFKSRSCCYELYFMNTKYNRS